jgi:type IV secretory pathway TrbF-like protein
VADAPAEGTRTYYRGNGTRYDGAKAHIEETTENIFTERAWWRRGFFAVLGLLALCILVVVSLAKRPMYEPIFIRVNSAGQLQTLKWEAYDPEYEAIKKELIQWLRCVRALPTSEPQLDFCWAIVRLFLLEKTQATETVKAFYQALQPKKLLFQKEIQVNDVKGRQEPDGRWRLEWTEDVYAFRQKQGLGRRESSERMSAILTVTRRKPTERKQIEYQGETVNPLGLYILSLGWGS